VKPDLVTPERMLLRWGENCLYHCIMAYRTAQQQHNKHNHYRKQQRNTQTVDGGKKKKKKKKKRMRWEKKTWRELEGEKRVIRKSGRDRAKEGEKKIGGR